MKAVDGSKGGTDEAIITRSGLLGWYREFVDGVWSTRQTRIYRWEIFQGINKTYSFSAM